MEVLANRFEVEHVEPRPLGRSCLVTVGIDLVFERVEREPETVAFVCRCRR